MKKQLSVHYCKANVKTNNPIVITDKEGKAKNRTHWKMRVYDVSGKPIDLRIDFNNSEGAARKSGARAVLQIWK